MEEYPPPPIDLSTLPAKPGVYLMLSKGGRVLYVGKAKNLRVRVKQYFVPGRDSREMVPKLVQQVASIETIVVGSEKEALLLENTLIKRHQPKYNVIFRDDKSYICLALSDKDAWPMVSIVREYGQMRRDDRHFGPYSSAYSARQTLDLIQRQFPLRQCSDAEFARRKRPCLLYGMKRCLAPCVGLCTKEEYDAAVDRTRDFLCGKDRTLMAALEEQMRDASEQLDFERAGEIYESIRHVKLTMEAQHVDLLDRLHRDVFGIHRRGQLLIIAQLIFREGRLINSHLFRCDPVLEDDGAFLESWLIQRYREIEELPQELLLPPVIANPQALKEALLENKEGERKGLQLTQPKLGVKRRLVELAETNAREGWGGGKRDQGSQEALLNDLQEVCRLQRFPKIIECIDLSNLSGKEPVGALVGYVDGEKAKARYRLYNLKAEVGSDDYAGLREVLNRRFKKVTEESELPDLLIIDGGKGHLGIALEVLRQLDIANIDLIGVAKEAGRHDKGMSQEQLFLPGSKQPIILSRHSPLLTFLQRIRDEAHRRAIGQQRGRREKAIRKSGLDAIKGIGPVKKRRLLAHFGSWKRIQAATHEELLEVKGITKRDAEVLSKRDQDRLN